MPRESVYSFSQAEQPRHAELKGHDMGKHIAIYVRVSSRVQDIKSQLPDLQRWAESQELPVTYYEDACSGKTMDRPGWQRLQAAVARGSVATVCCWRLDRLGRTARGLTALFAELAERKVNLVSLKDGVDLSTAAGRMLANVLASVAQFETELRGERVRAGIDAAHAAGKRWGGSKPGVPKKVTQDKYDAIMKLKSDGTPISRIARCLELSRSTIYAVLQTAPATNL